MSIEYVYRCAGCGYRQDSKWIGTCPGSGCYNDVLRTPGKNQGGTKDRVERGMVVSLRDVEAENLPRTSTKMPGLDKLLGIHKASGTTGFAGGQVIMISGDPGSGKSSLLLAAARGVCEERFGEDTSVLYVSLEETLEQVKERSDRLGEFPESMKIVQEADLRALLRLFYALRPHWIIIDSIQKVEVDEFATSSASAVKLAAEEFVKFAKRENVCIAIVAHISKDGNIAGPKTIEHDVDTTLKLYDRGKTRPRLLASKKNRYGSTDISVSYMMTEAGLIEVEPEPELEPEEGDEDKPSTTAPVLQMRPDLVSIPLDGDDENPDEAS